INSHNFLDVNIFYIMESSRNQYGFPVMNNEIIYVSRVFALKQKELVVISTSSFCFSVKQSTIDLY
ncbi:hypothetical protein, partial [Bacillus cereus]|uniref:hypothetical protein n=1 Tax=Bacillus cereus TaxID=1396 RepID=UPI001C54D4D9